MIEDLLLPDKMLSGPDATLDTTFVIGYMLQDTPGSMLQDDDTSEPRVLVLTTSIKCIFFAIQSQVLGYHGGVLMTDFTYKIFKELLATIVFSTVDIAQHGKLVAWGPSSHEDETNVAAASRFLETFASKLMKNVATGSLSPAWNPALCDAIYAAYRTMLTDSGQHMYAPKRGVSDLAPALVNGVVRSIPSITTGYWTHCWVHTWRALLNNKSKLKHADHMDEIMTDMTFLANLPPCFAELLWWEDSDGKRRDGAAIVLFKAKWCAKEPDYLEYIERVHLYHHWSRAWGDAGLPNNTNTLERLNRKLKSNEFFDKVEGFGTVVQQMGGTIGVRLSQDEEPMEYVPVVQGAVWKKAQKMHEKGHCKLAFKIPSTDVVALPSVSLLRDHMPDNLTTAQEQVLPHAPVLRPAFSSHPLSASCSQVDYLRTWAKEFIQLYKKPRTYKKLDMALHDAWDFDTLMDMVFSFWVMTPITSTDFKHDVLKGAGVCYKCTCPDYLHYHRCKHALSLALYRKEVSVPQRFSTRVAGKRKAIAGASLRKRSKCLEIDG